jgi:hypothetical protein
MIRRFAVAGSHLALFALTLYVPIGSEARSQDPAKPATQAQDSSSNTSPSPTSNTPKPKTKKVWTNDNVPESGSGISVVGSGHSGTNGSGGSGSKAQPKGAANSGSIDPRVIASLRDQLHRLTAQLNIVERMYSDLKAQSKGESKSSGGLQQNTYAYDSSSVEEQLQHLQEKKKRIETSIDELMEAARKAGIEPGDLR